MKTKTTDSQMLAVRSLNETRLLHPPTYVASRFLADSIASDSNSSWTSKSVSRRYPVQVVPRFFKFQRYKKRLENNQIEYRDFLAPSPLTCLAEALVLNELSSSESFRKPTSVYSYCWPSSPECPYNFDHYANGYQKRNAEISAALRLNPSCVAVVTDIEKFYPTIPHELVRRRFCGQLDEAALEPRIRDTCLNLFEHLVSGFPKGKGIATGPELSHVVGDIALSEVDAEFGRRMPGRYFRYVDDIIFVVEPAKRQETLNLLNHLLENAGLQTNPDKSDTVSSDDWLSHGPDHRRVVTEFSFEALVFRLKVFLAMKPGKAEALSAALRDQGFSIPIARIADAAGTSLFHRRLRLFQRKRWKVLFDALFQTEKDLVDYAIAVRIGIIQRLTSLFGAGFPTSASHRRWHIQRVRYLTNRALYLLPPSELGFVKGALAPQPEFAETTALLKLLQDGDCSDLLEMPGAAVSAAAAILRVSDSRDRKVFLPEVLSEAAIHSAGVMLLYGVAELQPALTQPPTTDAAAFLSFCAGKSPQSRERADFSYLDEIRSLQLNRTAEEHIDMLESRFSEEEAVPFEALEIGEEYFT